MELKLGAHISLSTELMDLSGEKVIPKSKLAQSLVFAKTRGFTAFQIHPTSPQRWSSTVTGPEIEEFNETLKIYKPSYILLHNIFLINLAGKNPENLSKSVGAISSYLELSEKLNLPDESKGVVFHIGSRKEWLDDKNGAINQVVELIELALKSTKSARLLLENSAGSEFTVGSILDDLALVRSLLSLSAQKRVGFCIDTQHLFASGYSFDESKTRQNVKLPPKTKTLAETITKVRSLLEDKLWAIHLNESATAFASGLDRHANIGEENSNIGQSDLSMFAKEFKNTPLILETPDHHLLSFETISSRLGF